MKKNFYSLLFRILFPVWLGWQMCWHLAFNYGFDYQHSDVYLLITLKLAVESLFFLLCGVSLYRARGKLSSIKGTIIVLLVCLSVYSLLTCFRII